jgi:hypothetical protein
LYNAVLKSKQAEKMTADEIDQLLNDKAASYWLKSALSSALKRDPIDALNDAEILFSTLFRRASAILNECEKPPHQNCALL